MLFSHISHKLQHLILKTFKALKLIIRISKFFGSRVGATKIDDEMCGKMPMFSDTRKLNKCVCVLFMQNILFTMNVWYIFTVKTFL